MHKELVFLKGYAKHAKYWQMLRAIAIAVKYHQGQYRKAGGDYVEHPMKVDSELVALGVDDEITLSAGLLHDVLEDCAVTRSELIMEYNFDKEVLDVVDLLTKGIPLTTEMYYKNMEKDIRAILIKVSDRCHNISTMTGAFSLKKQKEYIEETENYVLPLCKYGIRFYPEHSDKIVVMRNHIESVIVGIKASIAAQESLQEQLDAKDLIIQNKQRELDETILRMEKLQEKIAYLEKQNLIANAQV
jgi:GTP pyrophosphokinase